jgi:exportin-2 (importin alpha re-exporter)
MAIPKIQPLSITTPASIEMDHIASLLRLTVDPTHQRSSEQQLRSIEDSTPDFPAILLQIQRSSSFPAETRLLACIYLKNHIKKKWTNDESISHTSNESLSLSNKQLIKDQAVDCLLALEQPNAQQIMSDVIAQICAFDFPFQWESLLPSLVQNINLGNLERTTTILGCLNTIFKKYRYESRSDRLFAEIKFVLEAFAPTFFQIYRLLDEKLQRETVEKNKLALLKCMFLMNRIFYSLNFQDLPEFFEDEMKSFVGLFSKYLELNMPISFSSSDQEEGPLEKLRVSVLQNVNLYASKYAEDFPYIEQFVQAAWRVLGGLSTASKYDSLASASMLLLETVSKQFTFKHLFANEAFLGSIVEQILLPNILLRPQDIELFEDEPLEWVRKDVEGSSSAGDSRRASATELIRGLLTFHQAVLLPLLLGQVTKLLQMSSQGHSGESWKYKDAAIFLFTAASSSGSIVTAHGISQVNAVVQGELQAFFEGYILPELINASHELVLVDSLGFLVAFRHHLQVDTLVKALPLVVSLLSSSKISNEAVSTSAAIAIDRLLSLPSGKEANGALAQTAASSCEQIVSSLLSCLNSSGSIGNEFIIKALLRLILVARQNFAPHYAQLLAPLNAILQQLLLSAPSNPKFNHYLFESIAFLTRFSCTVTSASSEEINIQNYNVAESVLFATLQKVLQQDITEFIPYVFQILALLLHVAPKTCSAPSSSFLQLLTIVMHPSAWTTPANFPSLVKLLICFVRKWPSSFHELGPLMGIVQALLKSRVNDLLAIGLWNSIVQKVEPSFIQPFIRPMLLIVLQKLQAAKTPRTIHISLLFICNFIAFWPAEGKAEAMLQALEQIQSGLSISLIGNVLCPEAELLTEPNEKFMVLIAFTRLLEPLQKAGVPVELIQVIVGSINSLCKTSCKGTTFFEVFSTAAGEESLESNVEAGIEDENQQSNCRMAATAFIGSSAFLYRMESEKRAASMQELRTIVERIRFSGLVTDASSISHLLAALN